MSDFAKKLPPAAGMHAALFCTYGMHKGFAIKNLEKIIEKKGYEISGSFGCPGRDNWPPAKILGLSQNRPDMSDLEKAADFAKKLKLE
jgi:hypothetical protein